MKAWRSRSSSGGGIPQASAVAVAHVVSVVCPGAELVIWTFDRIVAAVADANAFTVDVEGGVVVTGGLGTTTITINYPNPHSAGEAWILDAVAAGITFSPAATIASTGGITT